MARPCKSAKVLTDYSQTKEEIEFRIQAEETLKGNSELKPPAYLNEKQTALFNFIISELENAGILCGLDTYMLETCVIAIDRLQEIESMINDDFGLIKNASLMSAKDKYTKDLYRCCNELSLSPQSRAKLANINLQAKQNEEDPLVKLLAGDD